MTLVKKSSTAFLAVLLVGLCLLQPISVVQAASAPSAESPSPEYLDTFYQLAPSYHPRQDLDLSFSEELAVTRPKENFTTSASSYFIAGTSDPEQPLTYAKIEMDQEPMEEELDRQGTRGLFGLYVDLQTGENTFAFYQNGTVAEITITREIPTAEESETIDTILEYSMVPSAKTIYRAGDTLIFSCIAPAGGKVVANIDGTLLPLTQVALADEGIPATYSASYVVPTSYPESLTSNLGTIGYDLTFDGKKSSHQSLGELYIAGENAQIMGEVNTFTGFVYPDINDLTTFKELLKQGSTDYIVNQYGGYYELASGGSIPREMMDIITTDRSIDSQLSQVQQEQKLGGEYLVFYGTDSPAYHGEETEDAFLFTLYNTSLQKDLTLKETTLFESGTVQQVDTSVVVTLPFKDTAHSVYYGYNVVFGTQGELFLEFQYKPRLAKGSQPLKNVTIMLDPGHGGEDLGAYGVLGVYGPAENDINLAHSYAVYDKLTALGATVYMTRYDDRTVSLDHRLRQFATRDADLFISLHHNSIEVTENANLPNGTESYYHLPLSESLATEITNEIVDATERTPRGTYQSYYRVTILPYAPSTLVELGFLTQPLEYEESLDPVEIDKVATAVANGVLQSLK